MRVTMVTTGTQGDVQPFVALGLGLRRAGYDVVLATHPEYEPMATSRGIAFRPVGVCFRDLLESPAGRAWVESGDSLLRYKKAFAEAFVPEALPRFIADMGDVMQDADALLFQPFALAAYHHAEQRGIPAICVSPFPLVGSGEVEPLVWPGAPRWRWLRRWANGLFGKVVWSVFGAAYNTQRVGLGLPAWTAANPLDELFARIPVLHAYSPSVMARPSDWGPLAEVSGYFFLDAGERWRPSPELEDFLASGPPPIYVGFGSMTGRDPAQLAELAVDAVTRAKQRAVLSSGWSGMGRAAALPGHVLRVESVPHDWLFPRVSAVIHHGGAGTTGAGLRAGKPTLVTAFFGDQPHWGRCVALAGAGPAPLHRKRLDAGKLADAIVRTLAEPRFREGAERVAKHLAHEDGVANAVAAVERHIGKPAAKLEARA